MTALPNIAEGMHDPLGVMLDTDIGKPAGPDTGERQQGFLLTNHPLLEPQPLDRRRSFILRFLLFTTTCHHALTAAHQQPVSDAEPCVLRDGEPSGVAPTR